MSFDFNQIQSLQKLLNESSISHSPQQQQQPSMPTTKMLVKTRVDPTSPTSSSTLLISDDLKPKKKLACDPKEIWTDDEIPDETALLANNNKHDTRPSPKFTYFFKNSLGTEEIFLGMNHTSNSSIDSTHLVIKVHFPGSIMKDLDLDVRSTYIRVSSKTHKLYTQLPVTVDSSKGNAKFDTKKDLLIVTLPIVHDL